MLNDTRHNFAFGLSAFALAFLMLWATATTRAQNPNLVINPSFELSPNGTCPAGTIDSFLAVVPNPTPPTGWVNPNFSSPEVYHRCANSQPFIGNIVGVPTNLVGTQQPHTGDAYMGFIAQSGFLPAINDDGYREYLQGTLSQPLVPGRQYCVIMWVVAADGLSITSPGIGLRMTTQAIRRYDYNSFEMAPHIKYQGGQFRDNVNWTLISGLVTADSAYAFVTVGNVEARGQTPGAAGPGGNFGLTGNAYYLVDDVSVREADSTLLRLITVSNDTAICSGTPLTLRVQGGDATTWNTGQTGATITVTPAVSTTYIATTEIDCFTRRDTIRVAVGTYVPSPDITLCPGEATTLVPPRVCGAPPYTFSWTALDGSFTNDPDSLQTVSPGATTSYRIVVTDGLGVVSTDTITVVIHNTVNVLAGTDNTLCPGEATTLRVLFADGCGRPYTYRWTAVGNPANTLGTDSTLQVVALADSQYVVTVTDARGLSGTDTVTVSVNRDFDVVARPDTALCAPGSVVLQNQRPHRLRPCALCLHLDSPGRLVQRYRLRPNRQPRQHHAVHR